HRPRPRAAAPGGRGRAGRHRHRRDCRRRGGGAMSPRAKRQTVPRTQTVLHLDSKSHQLPDDTDTVPDAAVLAAYFYTQGDDAAGNLKTEPVSVRLSGDLWRDLGKPDTLTVTVECGDTLN